MGGFDQSETRPCRRVGWCAARRLAFGFAVALGSEQALTGYAAAKERDPWNAALVARSVFEAQPSGAHTRGGYDTLMDRFRAIYHESPSDPHAAAAVAQVAELLTEQGRELHDTKSLRDAAGQYRFLARAYPGGSLAVHAARAATMLDVEARSGGLEPVQVAGVHGSPSAHDIVPPARPAKPAHEEARGSAAGAPQEDRTSRQPSSAATNRVPPASEDTSANHEVVAVDTPAHAPALVSAIRHWSTPTYTRVAIDLGDEVRFQAARVQNPDRIFFDLHHAKLASQLAGKSFAVNDEGFLTRIRAAQFSDEVTRVVLDVHEVAEYSAFLLPNPYRLIIDIHGRPGAGEAVAEKSHNGTPEDGRGEASAPLQSEVTGDAAAPPTVHRSQAAPLATPPSRSPQADTPQTPAEVARADHYIPRRSRAAVTPMPDPAAEAAPENQGSPMESGTPPRSNLPPMPVTDASTNFGLPSRSSVATGGAKATAPEPRVVIPSRPTTARPVPNTVATRSNGASTEVAAVSDQPGKVEATSGPTSQPVADLGNRQGSPEIASRRGRRARPSAETASPAMPAPPTAGGETSLLRALGLKIGRIVIDAGHGGHDSGTLGVDGLEEKDVVLDVALRLGKLLHERLGAEIVYTRADDTFIPLETRTAIANKAQADLFISVHANSSADSTARGVEVYYLNFTSDPEAMQVASRENAVSTKSVHELSDLVRRIALKDKIEESHELAADVDSSLYAGLAKGNDGLRDRGVKKAPFVVLIGANMPSILAEISFVTNPKDAASLNRPGYRERVAESLYSGVARYASNINGRKLDQTTQQAAR